MARARARASEKEGSYKVALRMIAGTPEYRRGISDYLDGIDLNPYPESRPFRERSPRYCWFMGWYDAFHRDTLRAFGGRAA